MTQQTMTRPPTVRRPMRPAAATRPTGVVKVAPPAKDNRQPLAVSSPTDLQAAPWVVEPVETTHRPSHDNHVEQLNPRETNTHQPDPRNSHRALATIIAGSLTLGLGGPALISVGAYHAYHLTQTTSVPIAELADTGFLDLVNADYAAPGDPAELVPASTAVAVRTDSISLRPESLAAAASFLNEGTAAGMGPFYVSSGYRSAEYQQQLWEKAEDRSFVQTAGHSEHQTGLAVDVGAKKIPWAQLGETPSGQWLVENAANFGFILRYPPEKSDITGISSEPWHFRYVGQPHATYMSQHGLTLEEYLAEVAETGGYQMQVDGVTYTVTYREPTHSEKLRVPKLGEYTVSSTNTDAYLITSWE